MAYTQVQLQDAMLILVVDMFQLVSPVLTVLEQRLGWSTAHTALTVYITATTITMWVWHASEEWQLTQYCSEVSKMKDEIDVIN